MCQEWWAAAARLPRVCAIRLPRLFGGPGRQPFEVTFEIGIIDLGEVPAFERIGPSFDLGAESVELNSVSYRHGQRRRLGIFAGNSSPGRGGLPLPARLSIRSAFLRSPRAARSAKYSSVRSAHLLGNGHVDELVHRHAFSLCDLSGLFHQ